MSTATLSLAHGSRVHDQRQRFARLVSESQSFKAAAMSGRPGSADTLGQLPAEFRALGVGSADYVIYSYETPIAWRIDGDWTVPDVRYSATTSRHQSLVRFFIAR